MKGWGDQQMHCPGDFMKEFPEKFEIKNFGGKKDFLCQERQDQKRVEK